MKNETNRNEQTNKRHFKQRNAVLNGFFDRVVTVMETVVTYKREGPLMMSTSPLQLKAWCARALQVRQPLWTDVLPSKPWVVVIEWGVGSMYVWIALHEWMYCHATIIEHRCVSAVPLSPSLPLSPLVRARCGGVHAMHVPERSRWISIVTSPVFIGELIFVEFSLFLSSLGRVLGHFRCGMITSLWWKQSKQWSNERLRADGNARRLVIENKR